MIKKVRNFMEKHHMTEPGDRIFLGVSGGADSVCLCLVLAELSEKMGFALEVVHVEHGIRGEESRQDAAFVQQLCEKLGVPYRRRDVDVPAYARKNHLGEEEAARILRYREFARAADGSRQPGRTKIAVAHHMEDNAETMLFQMIRGCGLDGMCGMAPVRTDDEKRVYIRPLLGIGRKEIESFLKERGQEYCRDSTNESMQYSRNRIRGRVIPELVKINPQAVAHMNRMAENLAELRDFTGQAAERGYAETVKKQEGKILVCAGKLMELPAFLQKQILHRAAGEAAGSKKDIAAVHILAVLELSEKQTGTSVNLPYGLVAKRSYDWIVIERPMDNRPHNVLQEISHGQLADLKENRTGRLDIEADGQSFVFRVFEFNGNFGKIPQKMYTKWFDYDKIKDGIFIRNRRPGDYFLMDASGHRKKLKDYLVDEKIPDTERDRLLLLAEESRILWVTGRRMGYGAQVTEDTKTILEVTWSSHMKVRPCGNDF